MKKYVKIALVAGNLGMALMACLLVSGSDSILAMMAATGWLAVAGWLCRKYAYLLND